MEVMVGRTFWDFWRSGSKTWWVTLPSLFNFIIFFFVFMMSLVEILLLGTGKKLIQPPPFMRAYLGRLGIQLDVMDTVRYQLSFLWISIS
jgi:uncharacterized protein